MTKVTRSLCEVPTMSFISIPRFVSRLSWPLVVMFCLPVSAWAQQEQHSTPLTLQEGVSIAPENNPQRKAALADERAADADVKEARSGLLPRIGFFETVTDGNDPIYVFGTKLRQQRFTSADFALNAPNTPTPLSNYTTRFDGGWNLFDSFASWHGIHRAERV